jgi:hypothetical protein
VITNGAKIQTLLGSSARSFSLSLSFPTISFRFGLMRGEERREDAGSYSFSCSFLLYCGSLVFSWCSVGVQSVSSLCLSCVHFVF